MYWQLSRQARGGARKAAFAAARRCASNMRGAVEARCRSIQPSYRSRQFAAEQTQRVGLRRGVKSRGAAATYEAIAETRSNQPCRSPVLAQCAGHPIGDGYQPRNEAACG